VTDTKHAVQRKSPGDDGKQRVAKAPVLFQLLKNYRSHGGIVNCAHSVVELIKRFWPSSIDNLDREKGIVGGVKPVFLTGWSGSQQREFFSDAGTG
jgi:hypothetical protein